VIPYKMGKPPKRAPEPAKSLKSLSCHISFAIFLHVNRHSKKALCNFNTRSYINCWHGMVVYLRLVALETAPPQKKHWEKLLMEDDATLSVWFEISHR